MTRETVWWWPSELTNRYFVIGSGDWKGGPHKPAAIKPETFKALQADSGIRLVEVRPPWIDPEPHTVIQKPYKRQRRLNLRGRSAT